MSEENKKTEVQNKSTTRKNEAKQATSSTKQRKKQTATKSKNITMAQIKRQAKEVNKMEEYVLDTDGETEIKVKFYPVFPHSKIQELLQELQDILVQANDQGVRFTDSQLNNHLLFLCIKHFTHLKNQISDKFEEQLVQMEHLIDTGVYEEIINEVFDQKEISKVYDKLAEIQAQYEFIMNIQETVQKNLENLRVKQKDLLNVNEEKIQKNIENKYLN